MSNQFVDHRDIISLYDLGHIQPHSPGMIHWHPNGMHVLNRLSDWIVGIHQSRGYQQVRSPILLSQSLWEQSGHWEKYKDLMFVASDEDLSYAVKPMSCPGHIAIYSHKNRSFRDLPFSMFELGHVHRNESSGSLSGWMRLRGFIQDDSHVICQSQQISEVIAGFVGMVDHAYRAFGFQSWSWRLSLRPEQRHGSDELWNQAEQALLDVCRQLGVEVVLAPGEGAFYGPKLEASLVDRLGRQWQCGVAQLDFVLPQRFGLSYHGSCGKPQVPVMIHHAVLGSLERWLSIVMEHHGGLPAWLSPHQVAILPISQDQSDHAWELAGKARALGLGVRVIEDGPLPGRVHQASLDKYEHIVVLGKREVAQLSVSLRQGSASVVLPQAQWLHQLSRDFSCP